MALPETKYVLIHGEVTEVVDLGNNLYTPPHSLMSVPPNQVFSDRREAMFQKALLEIKKGKSYTNFKVSKYYKYYLERLRQDHPEFLI